VRIKLLWADDDCEKNLEPLGWLLEEDFGLDVVKARNYKDAMALLEECQDDESSRIQSILLDTILPHSEGGASLSRYLGLSLASEAAEHHVKAIVFLTVVPQAEVRQHYHELRIRFPNIKWNYVNKADLLEFHQIRALVEYLSDGIE